MSKNLIGVIALVVVGLAALSLVFSGSSSIGTLGGAEFMSTYQATPNAVLLDVRTPAEYTDGHLAQAINIDYQSDAFASKIANLDKTAPYFVYCRSGSRSANAVELMKQSGFINIYQLQGGLQGNATLSLVTGEAAATVEYTVDASDMLNGNLVAEGAATALSETEIDGIMRMREEEKLARDVYTALGGKWGAKIFSNIANSERTHMDAMKSLITKYGLTDPVKNDAVGAFTSPVMKELYTNFVAQGQSSLLAALSVGAAIEDLDISDLDLLKTGTSNTDILVTYNNLQKGSRNHLRGYVRNISANGGSYTPTYVSQALFDSIISAPQEKGKL